jgi:hypothetical protein
MKTSPQQTEEHRVARQARLARVALIVGPLAGIAGAAYAMRRPKAAAATPTAPAPAQAPTPEKPKAARAGWHQKKAEAKVRFVPRKPPANAEEIGVPLKDLPKKRPLVAAKPLPKNPKNYTQIKARQRRILKDHTRGMMRVPKIKISEMNLFEARLSRINARLTEFARGKYVIDVLGGMAIPKRGSDFAKQSAARLREYRRKPLQQEVNSVVARMKSQGRPMKGFRVISEDEPYTYSKALAKTRGLLGSLEKVRAQYGKDALDIGSNPNNEVLIRDVKRSIRHLP